MPIDHDEMFGELSVYDKGNQRHEIDCDQIPPCAYSSIMKQGESDFNRGLKKAENPHLDGESRAAWFEGWAWGAYNAKNQPKH